MKKTLLALSSLGLIATPVVATVSCSTKIKKSYDFGVAVAPINSLNYIKYKNTATVAPALVEGLFKNGSNDKVLQSMLNFPTLDWKFASGSSSNAKLISNYFPLNELGFLPGSAISSSVGLSMVALTKEPNNPAYISQLAFQLNDKHKWSPWKDGDKDGRDNVLAKDYVDAIKYILDINTGSQLLVDVLEFGIRNASKIVDLQKEYYYLTGESYIDPFGYGDSKDPLSGKPVGKWQGQNKTKAGKLDTDPNWINSKGETQSTDIVSQIKEAAQGLGVFTASQYSSSDFDTNKVNNIAWFENMATVKNDYQLIYQFEDTKPLSRVKGFEFGRRSFFLPVNRDFVQKTGGIDKFGIDAGHLLWNSAYVPESIQLGSAGYINLIKDPNYYAAERTVSNKIKIFFQADPTVVSSMFEDGYVSDVRIPAVQQLNFWSNPEIRRYMTKQTGFGTLAFEFNLDNITGKPELKDENLRKAISYSIDRNALSLVAGQESSFPVTTWTAFGQAKDSYGNAIETYFDQEHFNVVDQTEHNKIVASSGLTPEVAAAKIPQTAPIQSYPFSVHNAKVLQFERVNRDDIGFNPYYARYFLEKYKEAHPDAKPLTLTYIYDGGQTVNKNVGIYLQSQLANILGGFVNIEIKGLPSNVFETFKTTGNFDMLYYNFDSYGTEWDSYIKRFFEADQIEVLSSDTSVKTKSEGFRDNPAGSWTYKSFFDSIKNNEAQIMQQLDIKQADWDEMKKLSDSPLQKRDEFFSLQAAAPYNMDVNVISVISGFEKIIRYAMPVLPLMEVDTYWEAKRIAGVDSLYQLQLQTAYDVENKPLAALPGISK